MSTAEFLVTEVRTGRTGALVRTPWYIVGDHYVPPGFRIVWDDQRPDDDDWDGE